MSAPKLTAIATLVDSGDRFVTIDAGYAGHFDLHFNERIPMAIAALNGQRNAVRVTVEPVDAPTPAPPRSAEEIAREMVGDPNPTWHWARIFGAEFSSATPDGIKTARRNVALLIEQSRADGAAAALAGQQPPDLAGRIRALIQEYAGRWADADVSMSGEHADVLVWLRAALRDARDGRDVAQTIAILRRFGDGRVLYNQAADDLEAIVRECAPEAR